MPETIESAQKNRKFTGCIYFFSSFDIGEEIDFKLIPEQLLSRLKNAQLPYFKSYHKPITLAVEECTVSASCESARLYNFGVIALRYHFRFEATLEELKKLVFELDESYRQKTIEDARAIFGKIRKAVRQPRFFHLQNWYTLIHAETQHDLGAFAIKEQYGSEIATVLRFDTEHLSDYKKNEIIGGAFGYYRGDLLVIDYDSALVYDTECNDLLDIFEFAGIRHMELQYFDHILDKQLNIVYERQPYKIPWQAYFPLLGMFSFDPIGELAKLKVDISVVSERLGSSIRFSEEPYYKDVYRNLSDKMDFKSWQSSLDKKLEIIRDILEVHQNRVAAIRYDVLNISVIVLIFMEVVVGLLGYIGK